MIQRTDQRGVQLDQTYDPAGRLTEQSISGAPGVSRQEYVYDTLNRVVSAANDHVEIIRVYDPLSRLTEETQSIRLDGTGFTNGWEHPISVVSGYDEQSNRLSIEVIDGSDTDLSVSSQWDALNRLDQVSAAYFGVAEHTVADDGYLGPRRLVRRTLGNGAALAIAYDAKQRISEHTWSGTGGMLVGWSYDYDTIDNLISSRLAHNGDLHDTFTYDERDLLVQSTRGATSAPSDVFSYDDTLNRQSASFGDPFGGEVFTDLYQSNAANEYIDIERSSAVYGLTHDHAGNTTQALVRPVAGLDPDPDQLASITYDAFNRPVGLTGAGSPQSYRYDPFNRRVMAATVFAPQISDGSRRFVWDGWQMVEERVFDSGATLGSAPSTLERVYVNGSRLDDVLLTAIDRNGDRVLGGAAPKNQRDIGADQEYYLLADRLGSTAALLDGDNADRVLEYYRYGSYGEPTVLPVLEDVNGIELTPLDLGDNYANEHLRFGEGYANFRLFTGRRYEPETGLYYQRRRDYEPRSGRFLSRDPLGLVDSPNLYQYAINSPRVLVDPLGLEVKCGQVSGTFVFIAGASAGVGYCWDECDNWGIVAFGSALVGADIGGGASVALYAGCLKDMVSGEQGWEVNVGVGPLSGGVSVSKDGELSGGRGGAGLSRWRFGASAGASSASLITGDTSEKCPCPPETDAEEPSRTVGGPSAEEVEDPEPPSADPPPAGGGVAPETDEMPSGPVLIGGRVIAPYPCP